MIVSEVDVSAVQDALSETSKSLKAIQRDTLRVVAKATAKTVRAAIISSDLHVRTGELRKAYTYKLKRKNERIVIIVGDIDKYIHI